MGKETPDEERKRLEAEEKKQLDDELNEKWIREGYNER